jgi:integrase
MARDLTTLAVKNAKAKPAKRAPEGPVVRTEIADGKCRGLFLVVQPSGARSWVFRFRHNGTPKKLTIGPVLDTREVPVADLPLGEPHTLAEARDVADAARIRARQGDDPTARAVRAVGLTVKQASTRFIDEYAKPRNRSWKETERQLEKYLLADLGDRPIADLTDDEIHERVTALTRAGSLAMANALHRTLSKVFKWCTEKNQKILRANPYTGFTMPNPTVERERVLTLDELARVWHAAGDVGQPFGALVRVLILTGQRREEVAGMKEAEINRPRCLWTIPGDRAKNGKANPVHLTAPAIAEIDSTVRVGKKGLVFSTTGTTPFSGFGKAKARLDSLVSAGEPWRLHDLRRTFATQLADLGVSQEVTEALLNHVSGTKAGVAGIYNRHDYAEQRRHALTAWARFVVDVVAHDAARETYGGLADTRKVKEAVHGTDEAWQGCAEALRGGAEAWQAYLAALDAPEAPEAADDAGEPEALEVAA